MRSLGWMEMAEQDLCEGRSSVAVHHCIRQLSYCRRDIRDSAGVWGEVSLMAITHMDNSNAFFNVPGDKSYGSSGSRKQSALSCGSSIFDVALLGQGDALSAPGSHVDPGRPGRSQPAPLSANQQHPCVGSRPRPRQVGRPRRFFKFLCFCT